MTLDISKLSEEFLEENDFDKALRQREVYGDSIFILSETPLTSPEPLYTPQQISDRIKKTSRPPKQIRGESGQFWISKNEIQKIIHPLTLPKTNSFGVKRLGFINHGFEEPRATNTELEKEYRKHSLETGEFRYNNNQIDHTQTNSLWQEKDLSFQADHYSIDILADIKISPVRGNAHQPKSKIIKSLVEINDLYQRIYGVHTSEDICGSVKLVMNSINYQNQCSGHTINVHRKHKKRNGRAGRGFSYKPEIPWLTAGHGITLTGYDETNVAEFEDLEDRARYDRINHDEQTLPKIEWAVVRSWKNSLTPSYTNSEDSRKNALRMKSVRQRVPTILKNHNIYRR